MTGRWWIQGTTAKPENVYGNVAHYEQGPNMLPLCGLLRGPYGRPFSVFQDVGRVLLCEKCRKKIQKSFRSVQVPAATVDHAPFPPYVILVHR